MPRMPKVYGDDWEDNNQFLGFGSTHTMSDDKPRAGEPRMGPIGFVHFPDHDAMPKRKKRRVSPAKSKRRR